MWLRLRLWWYRVDKELLVFVAAVGVIGAAIALAVRAASVERESARAEALARQERSLECLARNVYFEARGEPEAGQYAVAEVTMNRAASSRFPDSVCAVVYQKNWDPIRRRYVGAFSWTELPDLPKPSGEAWRQALQVAKDVFYRRRPPELPGVMWYHSISIHPVWAKDKRPLIRIGRHVFYK